MSALQTKEIEGGYTDIFKRVVLLSGQKVENVLPANLPVFEILYSFTFVKIGVLSIIQSALLQKKDKKQNPTSSKRLIIWENLSSLGGKGY